MPKHRADAVVGGDVPSVAHERREPDQVLAGRPDPEDAELLLAQFVFGPQTVSSISQMPTPASGEASRSFTPFSSMYRWVS